MKHSQTPYFHGVSWEEANGVSQAIKVKDTIYIAGQFSHDMEGNFIDGDIGVQTRKTLENLDRVLAGFGATKENIVEITIFLTRPAEDFRPCLDIFKAYVGDHRPAGTLIGVTYLASPEQIVEIRAVAHLD